MFEIHCCWKSIFRIRFILVLLLMAELFGICLGDIMMEKVDWLRSSVLFLNYH